jgi:hypothetical protein
MFKKLVLFTLLGISLVACTADSATETAAVYTEINPATIQVGDSVPSPSGEVILVIRGKITNTNHDDRLEFDMETLESLGVVQYEVNDDQATGDNAVFQGILLSQLLAVAQVTDDATTLHMVALNDYAIDIPIEDTKQYPVLLATQMNGEAMDVANYGPSRIIYPNLAFDLDATIYNPRWIWQLASIEVR